MIDVIQGNIAAQEADAIVNAANTRLFGGTGVCGAIFDGAGYDKMTKACQEVGHCDTGDAVVTPGFDLLARYVIHAVGPVYRSYSPKEASRLLESAYLNALGTADGLSLKSIVFPLISSGIYGFPKGEAVKIALETMHSYSQKHSDSSLEVVKLCLYSDEDLALASQVLRVLNNNE